MVEFNLDMPIVSTSSLEKQVDASVAESFQGDKSSVNGFISLKRKSQQDMDESRAGKRVKVDNDSGLSCNSLNEKGVAPTVPLRGNEGCQETIVGDELTKEKDDLRPFVPGIETSVAVGNGTDLTDLLRDLDDSGDSEDVDDVEFGGDPSKWLSFEANPRDAVTEKSNVTETEVQAQIPLVEPIINAVNLSSEKTDDIETEVRAHVHRRMTRETPSLEVIMLDSDSDDDDVLVMFDHLDEAPQLTNAVKSELGGFRQVRNESSHLANAMMQEPGGLRQTPNESPQLDNSLKVEHGSTRQAPHSMRSPGSQAGTLQNVLTAGQQQPGTMVELRIVDGKLGPYLARIPVIPQNAIRMPMFPFGDNLMHPGICLAYNFPYLYPSGCSTSFVPNNGYAQEATSGEQASRSHGLNPPTTLAAVPLGEQAGPSHSRNPSMASTAVPSSGDQAGPSYGLNPSLGSAGVSSSGDQDGPSYAWNPPNISAVVPFYSGARKAEPGFYDNTNLGPQNVPPHNRIAVAKPGYDSTVSIPRLNVARAMQQYDYYITKAKTDRAREALARTGATPNEVMKEENRRGLECRPDIVAYNEMKRECGNVNPGVTVGNLPGVEIGDRFTYRHQMAVVGLHRLPNVGIDYGRPLPDMIPTATAVVLMPKAGYLDDKDYGNTILYTGQGGRKKRNQGAPFVRDQELKKGNLALAINYERKLPVRVIRGHSILGNSGPGVLGYTYDGLYMITNYEFSLGFNGFNVYKYSLERLEDQPPIPPCIADCTAHEWNKARGALRALPLQIMDPPVEEDVKQLCK